MYHTLYHNTFTIAANFLTVGLSGSKHVENACEGKLQEVCGWLGLHCYNWE